VINEYTETEGGILAVTVIRSLSGNGWMDGWMDIKRLI
jgi:hypothetical protein